jgi:hypothetical protein
VQTLHELPDQIRNANQGLAGINLGPYALSVSCSTGLFGIYQHSYNGSVDFSRSREALQNVLQGAAEQSTNFNPLNQELSAWFGGGLQIISSRMAELRAVSKQVLAASGEMVVLLRDELVVGINQMLTMLGQTSQQLGVINGRFAGFMQQIDGYNSKLTDIETNLQDEFNHVRESVSDDINGWACGSDDGQGQLKSWQVTFTSATTVITSNLKTLGAYTDQANTCLAQIIGVVNNAITAFQPVAAELGQAANEDVSKFVEALHLDTAADLWANLAASARGASN